jgi:protein-ribulosamine 3-kinase
MSSIEEVHGPDVEWRELLEVTINKVVPRLLRPLETGGRQIQPRLVHGDLYAGNVSVDVVTGAPILFDATCLYAHNECKLEMMDISLAALRKQVTLRDGGQPDTRLGNPT